MRQLADQEVAACRLLREITGVRDDGICDIRRDACEACCQRTPPTVERTGDVIASLLFGISQKVIEREGVDGCDLGKAVGIKNWAFQNLRSNYSDELVDCEPFTRPRAASDCIYLGPLRPPPEEFDDREPSHGDVYECHHPRHGETTLDACYWCRDWAEEHRPPDLLQKMEESVESAAKPRVTRWAVGITTAPRRKPTLPWCLDSLVRAGWKQPRLFMDSRVDLPQRHAHLPVSLREPRLGAWPNYYLALVELLMREPQADAYLLLQDDAYLYDRENVRRHLETILWPGRAGTRVGAVSLYCSRAYTRREVGWHRKPGPWVWGALAFVFPRESAQRLVSDRHVLEHRWSERNAGCANIDIVIGEWAARNDLDIYFPTPSLVQHIGEVSTLWETGQVRGFRGAGQFAGDAPAKERGESEIP